MSPFLTQLSYIVNSIFDQNFFLAVVVIIGLFFLLQKEFWQAKIFLISLFLTAGLTFIIKRLVNAERPVDALIKLSDHAFPSGHAALSFFMLVFLTFYVLKSEKSRFIKILSIVIFSINAILICLSRLVLKVHTLDQVIVGALIGSIVTILVIHFTNNRKET